MSGKQDDKDKMNSRIYNLFFQYLVALLLTGDKETQFDVEVQRLSFDEKPLLRAKRMRAECASRSRRASKIRFPTKCRSAGLS